MIRILLLSFLAFLPAARAEIVIERGSQWRWRPGTAEASSPVAAWRGLGFNDSQFTTGPAPFWYGDPYAGGTQISGMQNVYSCLFLRKTFVLTNRANVERLELGAIVDDGFVAWINGQEVLRVRVPGASGDAVSINTLADNAVESVAFEIYDLPATSLLPGTNVLAVQVFQSSLGSSDLGFDSSLEVIFREPSPDLPPAIAALTPLAGSKVRTLTEVTVLFNTAVQGVDAGDFLVNNLPASRVTAITPSQYAFDFAQPATGRVAIAWLPNHGIRDVANPPREFTGTNWEYQLDPSLPTPAPYLSEFMASNSRTLGDEDGEFSDWIEIYNPGETALNLDGWALTDSTNNPARWRFPSTNLAPGGFIVVFASEKDRRNPGQRLHTNFKLAAEGEYLALVRPDSTIASELRPVFPAQVSDISFGVAHFGDPPFFTAGTNFIYFTAPTPGEANTGGTATPGPAILNVRHTPDVPLDNDNLLVTCRVLPSFYSIATVTLRYRVMFGSEVTVPMFDDGQHQDGAAGDGLFAAAIPATASSIGQMVRYYISATDVTGRASRWPLFPDRARSAEYLGTVIEPGYVKSPLPIIHLFAPPSILQPGPNTSSIGADSQTGSSGVSVFYDGEFYDNVYVALRGNTTAGYSKKSHRFEFTRDHPFRHPGVGYGWPEKPGPRIRRTSFVADYPDPTYMRQGLSFWLCDQVGSPASFYYSVRLQLNGQFYQLANHNDVHSEELLERLGYDPRGALYNAVGTVQPSQASTGGFEKKTREWEGNADYQQLANAISESLSVATRRTNLFEMLDLPNVINYLAVARFVQENDDVWANMSLYHDNDGDNLWRAVSFDMNLSWGAFFMDNPAYDQGIQATNDAHKSFPLYGSSQALSLTSGAYNRLYDVIFDVPQTLQMFRRRMRTILDTWVLPPDSPLGTSPVEKKILAWRDLIVADAALDRAKWGWPGIGGQNNLPPASVTEGVDDLLQEFFFLRRQHFYGKHSVTNTALPIGTSKTQNAGFPVAQPADSLVFVTSVDFNPASGNQDQEFICLTNPASIALDISGWKISGGVEFTFAPGTVVPANSPFYVSPNIRAFRDRITSPRGREGHFVLGPYREHLSARGETLQVINNLSNTVSVFEFPGAPTTAQQFLRITELMYQPTNVAGDLRSPEEYEYVQLKNISTNVFVDLSGIQFANGISFAFAGGASNRLAPGAVVYVVRNPAAFSERFGASLPVAGQYSGALDNNGERIQLLDGVGEEILDFRYESNWYPETGGAGLALAVVHENAAPDAWAFKSNWQPVNRSSVEDADVDGMPDQWEKMFGLNPQIADAELDADNDGMNNVAEFRAATDPTNPFSYLRIDLVTTVGFAARLEFVARPGRTYTVQFLDAISNRSWQKLSDVPASAQERIVTIEDRFGAPSRFYRLTTAGPF